jgi:hypothetical protein
VVNGLLPNLVPTFLHNIAPVNPLGAILRNPTEIPQLGCAIYQGISAAIPAALLGSTNARISAAESYLRRNLLPILPVPLYGCEFVGNSTVAVSLCPSFASTCDSRRSVTADHTRRSSGDSAWRWSSLRNLLRLNPSRVIHRLNLNSPTPRVY